MSEKMLQVCLEDYFESDPVESAASKEIDEKLNAYIRQRLSSREAFEIDNLASSLACEGRKCGFVDGFQYAIKFFGILQGGVMI